MNRIHRSSWRSCLAVAAAAAAIGSGVLLGTASASSPPEAPNPAPRESAGYSTAEDAVSAYMDALREADLPAMTGAFAIETFAANFDFTAYLERIRAYFPNAAVRLPASNSFNAALNVEFRAGQVVNGILFQYLRLCCPDHDPVQSVALPDEAAVADFVDGLSAQADSNVLSSIDSYTFVPLDEVSAETYERYTSDRSEADIASREAVLGADDTAEVAVRFQSADGEVYALFSTVRYGNSWWIHELGGTFANLLGVDVADGGIVPVDESGEAIPSD